MSKNQTQDWLDEQQHKIERNESIGWDGQTLKGMMHEGEELFEDTGHYQGLEELSFKNEDRKTYEQLFSQLRGRLVDARETSKDVSASPIVEQEGEICYVVYTPEGDSIACSTGILVHVHTMSDAIKYMVKHDYEEDPGIEPGDIFCNNDAQIGNAHTADVQTIIPIFWDGELIAWAAGVTHVVESGATQGGSVPFNNSHRYGDGFYAPARKIGKEFDLNKDWLVDAEHGVRTSDFWMLDERSRLTGVLMIRDTIHELVEEHGIENWKRFSREVIEESRRGTLNRINQMMVPGTYRGVGWGPLDLEDEEMTHPETTRQQILHAPLETTVEEDGRMYMDLEGANRWGWHSFNGSPAALQGGLWVSLTETLIPGEKVNDGAFYATGFNVPEGTWTNPQNTEIGHSNAWLGVNGLWSVLFKQLAQGYYSRGFLEETTAGYASTGNLLQGGGLNQYGMNHSTTNMEITCHGFGGTAVRDGPDYSAQFWNPEGDIGDKEIWEMTEPLLYLSRSVKPNTAGPGKYRGGSGLEAIRMAWNSTRWYMSNLSYAAGLMFAESGLFGGYPPATAYSLIAHDTDLQERFENQEPIPTNDHDPDSGEFEANVEGRIERRHKCMSTAEKYEDLDLYVNMVRGGPGYGDPLERPPESVAEDVEEGHLLERFADDIYGVVLEETGDGYTVDEEATEELRAEMREHRAQKAQPVDEWIEECRDSMLSGEREASEVVRKMLRSSMEMSEAFDEHFREFWDLPDEWGVPLDDDAELELQERLDTPQKRIWDREEYTAMYDM